jgi:hypothetical protein
MVTRTQHNGALFVGDCTNGQFTPGEIRCPNCDGLLEAEIAKAGDAYLVCNSMHRWRDRSWEVIAGICKSQP